MCCSCVYLLRHPSNAVGCTIQLCPSSSTEFVAPCLGGAPLLALPGLEGSSQVLLILLWAPWLPGLQLAPSVCKGLMTYCRIWQSLRREHALSSRFSWKLCFPSLCLQSTRKAWCPPIGYRTCAGRGSFFHLGTQVCVICVCWLGATPECLLEATSLFPELAPWLTQDWPGSVGPVLGWVLRSTNPLLMSEEGWRVWATTVSSLSPFHNGSVASVQAEDPVSSVSALWPVGSCGPHWRDRLWVLWRLPGHPLFTVAGFSSFSGFGSHSLSLFSSVGSCHFSNFSASSGPISLSERQVICQNLPCALGVLGPQLWVRWPYSSSCLCPSVLSRCLADYKTPLRSTFLLATEENVSQILYVMQYYFTWIMFI